MGCVAVFFIVTLIVSKVTSLHCSDQQLPASGDDDLQQATTLQYCLVDNCTIMMIDTGEKLDIVYTTDSLIAIIPTDGCTATVISRADIEPPCIETNIDLIVLIVGTDGYIVVVHLLFIKQLHNLFGMLLMF